MSVVGRSSFPDAKGNLARWQLYPNSEPVFARRNRVCEKLNVILTHHHSQGECDYTFGEESAWAHVSSTYTRHMVSGLADTFATCKHDGCLPPNGTQEPSSPSREK
jgi:hypothetical protein